MFVNVNAKFSDALRLMVTVGVGILAALSALSCLVSVLFPLPAKYGVHDPAINVIRAFDAMDLVLLAFVSMCLLAVKDKEVLSFARFMVRAVCIANLVVGLYGLAFYGIVDDRTACIGTSALFGLCWLAMNARIKWCGA
jgi:hypothetical protein